MIKQYSKTVSREDSDINITPARDVVFIMLIFFIVTASFVKEQGIPLSVPQSNQPERLDPPPTIVVKVTELQEIRIQNRIVNARAVRANIIRLRAEKPDAAVVVRVDRKAKTNLLVKAVDAIRAAQVGILSVSLVRS